MERGYSNVQTERWRETGIEMKKKERGEDRSRMECGEMN